MFAVRNTIDVKSAFHYPFETIYQFITNNKVWISTSSERTQGNSGAY